MNSRREFIKQGCAACLTIAGAGFLLSQQSCSAPAAAAKFTATNGELSVPLSSFGDQKTILIREASMKNDILLIRKPGDEFNAFLMKCTHKGGNLRKRDDMLVCSLHGSNFNLEGEVIRDPAKKSLHKFPAKLTGENVLITVL